MFRFRFLLLSLILFLLATKSVLAQSGPAGLSLILSPLPINLVADPGSTVSADLKIKNGGTQTEELQVGLMKFSAFGDRGKPRVADREKGDDYFDWVTFSDNSFVLAPNEWKTIKATINVPKDAAFGYYYAVTFARKNNNIVKDSKSTTIIGATASLILLEVRSPNAVRKITVEEFSTEKKFYEFLPIKFNVKLKNEGNVHLSPRGNIFIDSATKHDVAVLEINDNKGNVLPNSERVFESEWSGGFPVYVQKIDGEKVETDKNGKEIRKLNWDFNKVTQLRFGKYTANMLLAYDDGSRDVPIEAKVSFWIIPWRLIGGGIVILALIVSGLKSTFKSWSEKIKSMTKRKK